MTDSLFMKKLNQNLKKEGLSTGMIDSRKIYNCLIDSLFSHISAGYDVKIRNFGSFKSIFREFRSDIKNADSEKIQKVILKFKPSGVITDKLNGKKTTTQD